jgi:glycerol-3-phosphate dehydrogenase
LCNWIPIVIPFTSWHVSPPPFDHPLFGFFPILAPPVLKFYDALSQFTCPPSYVLTTRKVKDVFPQLEDSTLKYCAVFYEAQHNDARTNLAIALTAAEKGAAIANYVEMVDCIKEGDDDGNKTSAGESSNRVIGVKALDRMTGETFEIRAKKVVFAGGPFTDSMREMEEDSDKMTPAVSGGPGTHIVLPGYLCPSNVSS